MSNVLVFGAGKSSTALIKYLLVNSEKNNWQVTVADSSMEAAKIKINHHVNGKPIEVDINDGIQRAELIKDATIVVSLLPPGLHYLVAKDCVRLEKSLLTASYVDEKMQLLANEIKDKGLLFLCEMGLDPGIDHMSAMKIINDIHKKGGKITSFKSHCGGLVAPESDTNPWHYKISWNPRNVVMAGKAGAEFLIKSKPVQVPYEKLFSNDETVSIPGLGSLAWYPNRDSLSYISLYKLFDAKTFIRTTLRYPAFITGWKKIIELKLTDETVQYQTDDMSLQTFFQQHFLKNGFADYIKDLTSNKHEKLFYEQLCYLGLHDSETIINRGKCSAADVLQFALEKKLVLQPADKDMVVMLHEIDYEINEEIISINSSLVVKGEDAVHTAMAKTVGLPLGIAVKLILEKRIEETGLHIPTIASIYKPVLEELAKHDIIFTETTASKKI